MFDSKLNFLMELTDTTNNSLAKACALDGSYISRLRTGKRKLPKKQNYLSEIVDYLIKRIREPYQCKFLTQAIGYDGDTSDMIELKEEVEEWLKSNDPLTDLEDYMERLRDYTLFSDLSLLEQESEASMYYYGMKGKRKAVERFLSDVIKSKKKHTICLYSDETANWLVMDPTFAKRWSELMSSVMQNGNKICIIHDIDRKYGEMQQSLKNWMPLYMTGQIVAYYYPGIRDGILNTTRFIAPGIAAILSSNVEDSVEDNLSLYITNQKAIVALESEFNSYKAMCEPLMQHYDIRKYNEYWNLHKQQYDCGQDIICISDSLSLVGFPFNTPVHGKAAHPTFSINILSELQNTLVSSMSKRSYTEIVPLELLDPDEKNMPLIYKSGFLQLKDHQYDRDLLRNHLKEKIRLLKESQNYHLLPARQLQNNLHCQIAANHSVIFTAPGNFAVALSMVEQRMVSSTLEFVERIRVTECITDRSEILRLLERKIESL